jgi:hypothetical protein
VRALHATDGEVGAGLDEPGLGIEKAVTHMHAKDFADDEAVVADFEDAVAAAFEAGGSFDDARRLYGGAGRSGEASVSEFVFSWRQGGSAEVHLLSDGFIDEVYDELVREADVPRGVLRHAGFAVAGTDADDGR